MKLFKPAKVLVFIGKYRQKVADYQAAHPDADIIRLGIGDVTLPLVPAIIDAMSKAVQEMGKLKHSMVTVLNKVILHVKLLLMATKPLGVDIGD